MAQADEQGAHGIAADGRAISSHEAPVVLTVPGRKSGKPRSTPITPTHVDGKRYVVNGYPGADWVSNVRAALEGPAGRLPVFRIDPIT
jgi:F420H(2)-dependent quinone reductase